MKKLNILLCVLFFVASMPHLFAQSQALNGQIEGTVLDANKAAVAHAAITATNIETGASRSVTTNESSVYRFPLLPLGTYRISAEAVNFKKFVREGIILAAGQTATIDINLQAGDIKETVTVSADSSVADAGKTDLGRVMNSREVQNLPLIQRNPYNFALLQANVTGRPSSRGFGFPSANVNGYLRQVNYQLDGNTNTQADSRIRFLNISETFVREIQIVTNGFAAEFGNTPGMIFNVITPAGTNKISGALAYRFRFPSFYSRPFFFPAAVDLPDDKANIWTATVGAPIIKDRWQFYFGFERQYRDDKATAPRLVTITAANRDALIAAGLSPAIFVPAIPSLEKGAFYIFRSDAQLNKNNRLSARFNLADTTSDNFITGGLNTLERSVDVFQFNYAFAVQLASYTPKFFNEFRFQYGWRTPGAKRNEFSGTGPSIVINGVANFGSPQGFDTIFPPLRIIQFQDNLTRVAGPHILKFGGGFSFHNYTDRASIFSRYNFSNLNNYLAARNGTNPRSYVSYTETFGNREINFKATYWNFFVQDDWKVTPRLKFNFGLRYDLYQIPKADAASLFPLSRKFNVDKNDFAPRFGVVYALREGTRPTVLRAGAGIYYDAPLLAIYRDVLRVNGTRFFNFSFTPNSPNAPAFPNNFSGTFPAGSVLPPQNIFTIAPDFETMYAIHSNIQLEQALTENLSFAVGYVFSAGRHINVYRNINPTNTTGFLSDGRPIFGSQRLDARFNQIVIAESGGNARYDALVLQLNRRLSRGFQFSINYTLSRGINDAPDGDIEGLFLSDPSNRATDRGFSSADQRHTFVMSMVFQPKFNFANKTLRALFNNNQFGIIARANSGERFSVFSAFDLNNDGRFFDRPSGFRRNSETTPPQFNVDLRYSRFLNFGERSKIELFCEFTNLFNTNSIIGFTNTSVTTNQTTGELIGAFPDFKARNQSTAQESRQVQLGIRFVF
jgi:hypothetical protein